MFDSDELVVSDPAMIANTELKTILGSFIAGSVTCSSCCRRLESIRRASIQIVQLLAR